MADNYQKYLETRDKNFNLPDQFMEDFVQEATGRKVLEKKKILKGEANQVFEVTTQGGFQVIVRISIREKLDFLQEKWAIDRCQSLGIPVPEILLIKHLKIDNVQYSVCIQKKIKGDTLERGEIDMVKLPEVDLKALTLQAGEILAKIHSIDTTGFGLLDNEGQGRSPTFSKEISEAVEKKEGLMELARKTNMDLNIMESIINLLANSSKKFTNLKPKLNHGDYGPKHFMVKENKIVGLLDFGESRSDSPVYDFAWWDFWFSDSNRSRDGKMFELLKEGYTDKSLFNDDFDVIRTLIKLSIGLGIFYWYDYKGYSDGVEAAKQRLIQNFNLYQP
jgi:aminoglycoside phosphotransferase (APT) family kinase protein